MDDLLLNGSFMLRNIVILGVMEKKEGENENISFCRRNCAVQLNCQFLPEHGCNQKPASHPGILICTAWISFLRITWHHLRFYLCVHRQHFSMGKQNEEKISKQELDRVNVSKTDKTWNFPRKGFKRIPRKLEERQLTIHIPTCY